MCSYFEYRKMMDTFIDILRQYPAIALFLTVGTGFLIGKIRYRSFSIGSVTAVLLTGVLVGQLRISMSGPMKTVFFMMFLFSIGYSVGPQFFRSLRGAGLKQVLFAVIMSSSCFGVTLLIALLLSYSPGETVGLFSGSQTCSALMGVGGDAISRLPLADAIKDRELSIIPVCYAVTYIYGTLGTVIILANFGPKLQGGLEKIRRQTKELEAKLDENSWESDPACVNALRVAAYRAYRVENEFFKDGKTVKETEAELKSQGLPLYVDRIKSGKRIYAANADRIIHKGDTAVLCGRREYIVQDHGLIGPEVSDEKLLSYPLEKIPVLVTKRSVTGKTAPALSGQRYMHGIIINSITRHGSNVEISDDTTIEKGDVLLLTGHHSRLKSAAVHIGHMDRPTTSSDLMFVGLAIFIGGVIGAVTIMFGDIPVSFGTSGGALIAGLVFGWLRSKRPTFGHIPDSALWIMNNLGLNVFVAVIGIEAAPSFISGIKEVGPMLLVVGAIGTSLPLLFGLWLGHKIFKFHPAITLGCCAGTRTCTAALGAVQETLGSSLPAMGYTITYAVSNILLVIWGMIAVLIVS